jgi:cysteine-rich repeat protein
MLFQPSKGLMPVLAAVLLLGCGNAFKATGEADSSTDADADETDGTVGCTSDDECNDGNPCNGTETCGSDGTCEDGTPLSDGAPCESDGIEGTCQDELCVPLTCGDGDVDAGEECDDGNSTAGDGCEDTCLYTCHVDSDCADENVCTDDSCTEGGTGRICAYENNTAPCDDGNECTEGDTCSGGSCVPGTNTCECETTEDCAEHEDGDLCNGTLVCDTETSTCVVDPGTVVSCAPTSTLCHVLVCVPETGLCVDDNPSAGTACEDDSNACTEDVCDGEGACTHPEITCTDGNVCTDDSCDTTSGCVFTNNTASCDDGNACTAGDTCSGGTCVGGMSIACNDRNPCTDDSCDPTSGCVFAPNTDPCDDGDPCTDPDACSGGTCTGTPLPLWYYDGDSDAYGDAARSICAASAPTDYVGNDDDCCDSEPTVNPAQTSYFIHPYTCISDPPSFDYNCDTVPEPHWTSIASCVWDSTSGTCVQTLGWIVGPGVGPPACGVTGTWMGGCMISTGMCSIGASTTRVQECR